MSLQTIIANLMFKLPPKWLVRLSGGEPIEIDGRVLDPHIQFAGHAARNAPGYETMSAEDAQAAAIAGFEMLAGDPEPGVSFEDFTIPGDSAHQIPVRLYKPADQDPDTPLMAYFHMGGGVIGNLETCHVFCTILAAISRGPILSVDYRLAPQHKFPAGLDDCQTAYEWCLRQAEHHGAPAGKAAVGGDSMGANFAAIISQDMLEGQKPLPELQLLIYPATDADTSASQSHTDFAEAFPLSARTMKWFYEQYLPEGHDPLDVRVSPAQNMSLEGLPPAIVITAGFDILGDEGRAYAQRLSDAGVPTISKVYDSLAHGFTAFTGFSPASDSACREIAGLVRTAYTKANI